MKKSKIALLLGLAALSGGLAACTKTEGKLKIGVILYSYSDIQGSTIKAYCDYLSQNLDLEFQYEATNYQDDLHPTALENLISAGCKGIISGYDTSLVSSVATCQDADVYYTLALDYASKSDFKDTEVSDHFLGGTTQFGGDLAALGAAYGQAFLAAGLKNVGGVSFPAWAFVEAPEIYASFKSTIEAGNSQASVKDLEFASGFMKDNVASATNKVLNENPGLEAIFGMSSGLEYVLPEIVDKNVKLISMGYSDAVASNLESGKLLASGTNNYVQAIASCVARIMNAVDGKSYSDAASGVYNKDGIVNGVSSYPLITSASEVSDYEVYALGKAGSFDKSPVSVEELKNVVLRYNEKATLAGLNALTNRSLADIKAAHSK